MSKQMEAVIKRIDELVKEANPKDGSAPLGPVIILGNLVATRWPAIRQALTNGQLGGE